MPIDDLTDLGTVAMVWAHPDDETYLAGGLTISLTDSGRRVVCVTATRGEAGGDATERTHELEQALTVLGVAEHHWLDLPDGGCAGIDGSAQLASTLDAVAPDTVITFGPDGFTGHPDHRAVSRWTDHALAGRDARVLHAVSGPEPLDLDLDESFGVFELGRPRTCPDDEAALVLRLGGEILDRKVQALLCQASQTQHLVDAVGIDRFRTWVSREMFADPVPGR